MEIFSIIYAAVCAIWAADICRTKKRTEWKGFLAGIMLGLFGVLICLMIKDKSNG